MVITKRFPTRYYNQIDFAYVMAVVMFLVFTIIMVSIPSLQGYSFVNTPRVEHSVDLPSPEWRELMILAIMRDGTMYLGQDKVASIGLADKLRTGMRNAKQDKRLYLRVDSRTRYGYVNEAIDAIHEAGIQDVAFFVEQRRTSSERLP